MDKQTEWQTKNLVAKIEEVLVFKHGLRNGSAITQAVAYVIFGMHARLLVNHGDTFETLSKAVTRVLVLSAINQAQITLEQFKASLKDCDVLGKAVAL